MTDYLYGEKTSSHFPIGTLILAIGYPKLCYIYLFFCCLRKKSITSPYPFLFSSFNSSSLKNLSIEMEETWIPLEEGFVKISVHFIRSEIPLQNGNSNGVGVLIRNSLGRNCGELWGQWWVKMKSRHYCGLFRQL